LSLIDLLVAEYRLVYGELFRRKSAIVTMIMYPYLFAGFTVFVGYAYGNPQYFVERTGVDPVVFMVTASYILMALMTTVDELFWRPLVDQWVGTLPYILATPVNRLKRYFSIPIPRLTILIITGSTSVIPIHVYYSGFKGLATGLSIILLTTIGAIISIGFSMVITGLVHRIGESWRTLNIIRPIIMILIGAYFPRKYMFIFARYVSYLIPASHVVEIIQGLMSGLETPLYILLSLAIALSIIYTPLGSKTIDVWEKKKVREGVKFS